MTHGPAIHDVTITDIGGGNPVTLPSNGVDVSWVVDPPGTISVEFVTADLIDAFATVDLRGKWIEWAAHPTVGDWAGEITATEPTKATGTCEVAGRTFEELFVARRTAKEYDLPATPAAGLQQRIARDSGRASPLWITDFLSDEVTPSIPYQARADEAYAALQRIAAESGIEWWVTNARVMESRLRKGRDLRASVQLVEDRQIVDFHFPHLLDPVRNDVLAIPADDRFVQTTSLIVDDEASIQAHGLRQTTVVFDGMRSETQLKPAAHAALARLIALGRALTLTLTEDEDECFGWMGEGDTVSVLLPSVNWEGAARFMVRSYSSTTNLLTATCQVVS